MIAAAATAIAAPIGAEQKAEEKNRKPPPFAEKRKGMGHPKNLGESEFQMVGHPPKSGREEPKTPTL